MQYKIGMIFLCICVYLWMICSLVISITGVNPEPIGEITWSEYHETKKIPNLNIRSFNVSGAHLHTDYEHSEKVYNIDEDSTKRFMLGIDETVNGYVFVEFSGRNIEDFIFWYDESKTTVEIGRIYDNKKQNWTVLEIRCRIKAGEEDVLNIVSARDGRTIHKMTLIGMQPEDGKIVYQEEKASIYHKKEDCTDNAVYKTTLLDVTLEHINPCKICCIE